MAYLPAHGELGLEYHSDTSPPSTKTVRILQKITKNMLKKRSAAFKILLLLARFVLNFVRPTSVDEG